MYENGVLIISMTLGFIIATSIIIDLYRLFLSFINDDVFISILDYLYPLGREHMVINKIEILIITYAIFAVAILVIALIWPVLIIGGLIYLAADFARKRNLMLSKIAELEGKEK